jgi:RNase_H superfamily
MKAKLASKHRCSTTTKQRPRVLLIDLEVSMAVATTWAGNMWRTKLNRIEQPSYLLSYAWQWADEDQVHVKALPDYKNYKPTKQNDLFLVRDLHKLFEEADVIIGYNSTRYDVRIAQARFLYHGLPAPSPFKEVDVLKIIKKYFQLPSNRLTDVTTFLNLGQKLEHSGMALWFDVMAGNSEAWKTMIEYNKQDIVILKLLYDKVRSWARNHVDLSRYFDFICCPVCTSYDLEYRGWDYSKKKPHRRIHCASCGHWSLL